jgi:hypothetical protein
MAEEQVDHDVDGRDEPWHSEPTQRSRQCAVCGVRLSLYNPGPHCWSHTIGHPWRGPTAKPRF